MIFSTHDNSEGDNLFFCTHLTFSSMLCLLYIMINHYHHGYGLQGSSQSTSPA
ncbi:hypothetical protein PanWU01x14_014010 [Parasponia andersonii]|uniref:Transmembrane protein n=1 Tax=Parasponia andersonii TaxID=3476 RepID=A0A2P5E162_PARAD|nr:hypothetical protein PanWU01x14_014010 [Parasponia andersonii]